VRLYQLAAHGNLARLEGEGLIVSKEAHKSQKAAWAARDAFIEKCTTPVDDFDIAVLEREGLAITVTELELVDDC